jgi:anti-sigma-K factor RskA
MGKAQSKDWGRDVNYLLGQLSEEERDAVRAELLTDAEAFDRVRDVENDLFDAYARGTMSSEQRAAFEDTLLRQPDADAKLRAARALMAPAARQRLFRWWYVPAAIAAAVSAFLLRDMPQRIELAPPAPIVAAVVSQSFRLATVTRGASNVAELKVEPATTEMEFVAEVPAGPRMEPYAIAVERAAGGTVWSGIATVAGDELRWRLPVLAAGGYVIRVGNTGEPLAFYEIRVVR